MICLSREQILMLHHQLIERYGGSHGIRFPLKQTAPS